MSMSETEKWASRIINELFEEGNASDGNLVKNSADEKFEVTPLENDLIESKHESCKEDVVSTEKFTEKSDLFNANSDKSLDTNDDENFERNLLDLSLIKSQNDSACSNKEVIILSPSCKNSDHGAEYSLVNTDMPDEVFTDSGEVAVKEALNSILSIVEHIIEEENSVKDNLNAQFYKSEEFSTKPFITETDFTKIENKNDEFSSPLSDMESFTEDDALVLSRIDKKVKFLGFKGYTTQNSIGNDKEFKRSQSLNDLYFDWFRGNFIKEEIKFRLDPYDLEHKKMDKERSCQKPETNIFDDLINFDEKEVDKHMFGTKNVVRDVHPERKYAFDGFSTGDTKAKNFKYFFKGEQSKPEAKHRGDLVSVYQKFGKKSLKGNATGKTEILGNLIARNHGIYPNKKETISLSGTGRNGASSSKVANRKRKVSCDESDERLVNVITVYRNICTTIEELFVRPCAMLIAGLAEFFTFLFFLSFCTIYMLYKKVYAEWLAHSPRNDKMVSGGSPTTKSSDELMKNETCGYSSKNTQEGETALRIKPGGAESVTGFASEVNNRLTVTFKFIDPKDVSIFDMKLERASPLYEKAEYFEFVKEEKHATEVKLHEECLVDIVWRTSEERMEENEFDMEIVASSSRPEHNQREMEERDPCEILRFSESLPETSTEPGVNSEHNILTLIQSKNTLFKPFPNIFQRDEKYILNSTEVDDLEFATKTESRERCSFKILSISNEAIPDVSGNCVQLMISKEVGASLSSLKVNLPSFQSRIDEDFETTLSTSLDKMEDVCNKWCSTPAGKGTIPKELEDADDGEVSYVVDLNSCSSEGFEHGETAHTSLIQKRKKAHGKLFRSLNHSFHKYLKYPDDSPNQSVGIFQEHISDMSQDNSFLFENEQLTSERSIGDSSQELNSLVEEDRVSKSEKEVKNKASGGIRRRLSTILNNWKNMQVAHCATANPRKKCKKRSKAK